MKSFAAGALAVFLAFGGPAVAQTASRTLTMNGEGVARAVPDRVEISAGVTSDATTAAAALSANNARMAGLFATLEKLRVPAINIQTQNFSVSPQYASAPNTAPRLTGYSVSDDVHVVLDDVAMLGATLDALVSAGANQMNGLNFTIKNNAELLARARADAVADARTRAQQYAAAAGLSLGPILSLSENSGEVPRPMNRVMAMAAPGIVPVAAGEESVIATVSVVWEIR
jgi:uncharacterized protein YggE